VSGGGTELLGGDLFGSLTFHLLAYGLDFGVDGALQGVQSGGISEPELGGVLQIGEVQTRVLAT